MYRLIILLLLSCSYSFGQIHEVGLFFGGSNAIADVGSGKYISPNDIAIGMPESHTGIMLFGTNAVGKSSLIRSLGMSVVLAQAGFFVPCSSFTYKPYSSIFTRILGNDDIFKGLSTFAVEMSELRTILQLTDENSLILGDELCSGNGTLDVATPNITKGSISTCV